MDLIIITYFAIFASAPCIIVLEFDVILGFNVIKACDGLFARHW